jgi:hypothetical protein
LLQRRTIFRIQRFEVALGRGGAVCRYGREDDGGGEGMFALVSNLLFFLIFGT